MAQGNQLIHAYGMFNGGKYRYRISPNRIDTASAKQDLLKRLRTKKSP